MSRVFQEANSARTCFQLPKGFYSLIHVFLLLGTNFQADMVSNAAHMFARWSQEDFLQSLAQFGAIALPAELEARQVAAYEREKGRLKEEIDFLQADLTKQKAQRKETPKHVRLADLPEQECFVPLSPTRKQFLDTIKMIAYRAETALAGMLCETLSRTDETRALLRETFAREADLLPDETA